MQGFTPVTLPSEIAQKLSQQWSVAITGASGWMGQALLEALEAVYTTDFDNRVVAFGSSARPLTLRSGRIVQLQPTEMLGTLPKGNWLLAHCAYGTRDRVATQGNDAFIDANQALTETVTHAIRQFQPQRIFFPSSGAVYDANGALSTNLEANPYGVLKHRDELHFIRLAQEIGARIIIPRVFNMCGPFINKWSAYALSDFILQALDAKPIGINASNAVMRSYVHVSDILALSLAWVLDETPATVLTFDTRGEDVELAELAQQIERDIRGEISSSIRIADSNAPASLYLGQQEPMQTLCAHYQITLKTMQQQIQDTWHYIRNAREAL